MPYYLICVSQPAAPEIHSNSVARAKSALFPDRPLAKVHHPGLRAEYHMPVIRHGISQRSQAVSVEMGPYCGTVGEYNGCRAVPWFHEQRLEFEEGPRLIRHV
jgi:hypothetical protein